MKPSQFLHRDVEIIETGKNKLWYTGNVQLFTPTELIIKRNGILASLRKNPRFLLNWYDSDSQTFKTIHGTIFKIKLIN